MSAYRASYRRMFTAHGRRVTIERRVPNGAQPIRAENVRVRLFDAAEIEVGNGNTSTQRRVLVLAEDVPAALTPLLKGDRILVDGLVLLFSNRPDDQTKRDGEVLLAYDGLVVGA